MGNSNSTKVRAEPRSPLPKMFNVTSTLSPTKRSKHDELRVRETELSERAYRHHRKRLARIVADQWMHVARHRLVTLKFRIKRETNIKRFCITEWRNVVEHRARMSHIVERARVLCHFLMERRSFYAWKKAFLRNRVLGDAFRRTIDMVRCKQRLTVFIAFQKHSQAKIMKRKHFEKAEDFSNLHVLERCCTQWLSYVGARAFKLELNTRAPNKWTNNLLESVLRGWKKATLLEEVHKTDRGAAKDPVPHAKVNGSDQVRSSSSEDPILQTQIVTKCFWCWYLLVSQKKTAVEHTRQCEDESLILVVRHYERNLQRRAYDGWKTFASQSRLAKSISEPSQELDALSNVRPQSETLEYHKTSRRVWGTGQKENARALCELLKQKYCGTSSRKEWTIRQNDYATAKKELEQMYSSAGSRKVWTIGLNGYTKTKSEILKLMYCSKPSSREVAVSWFVTALAKRCFCIWKEQVLSLKRHRLNHWYAVVHSKTQCLLKGFHALRENVDAKQSKQCLQELSVNCYHHNLKRKTVSGCKFLHQTKRVKLVQIEHATAQWRTAKLQEGFEKWSLATALRSMRRNQHQKSVHFRNRQLLLHTFQAWHDIKGLSEERGNLKMTQLTRLRGSLAKFKKSRILSSWKALRKEINISRFNQARALQFFIGFRAAHVVKALYVHKQEQKLKRSVLAKAAHVQKIRLFKFGIRTWSEYVMLKNLSRLAAGHRRYRLLKHAITCLMQWHQPHVEFSNVEEDHGLLQTTSISRGLHTRDATSTQKSAPVMPARPQPRRPAFLYEDVAQTQAQNSQRDRNAEEKRSPGGWTPRDPNLVAKEIEWMEHVLLDYEALNMHIVRLRAALQLEQSSPGVNGGLDQRDHKIPNGQDKNILLLQQEISSLEAKKLVQRPLIHAVVSRVQDLQTGEII